MSTNLDTVLLWEDAVERFENQELPFIEQRFEQGGIPDYVARSEHWNNWTDMLCKNDEISDWQYDNWGHPDCCLTEREKEDQRRREERQ